MRGEFSTWASRATLDRYDEIRGPHGEFIDYKLPVEIGRIHAHVPMTAPTINDRAVFKTQPPVATACGSPGKVILPVPFDPGDPDACASCAALDYQRTTGQITASQWRAAGSDQRSRRMRGHEDDYWYHPDEGA